MSITEIRGIKEDKAVTQVKAMLTLKENLSVEITDKRVAEIKQWVNEHKPYLHFDKIIAPHILKQDILKEISAIALFSVRKPFYALIISEPAVAKSQIALWIEKRTANTKFIEGTKLTSAGLTMTKMGKTIIMGALPQTHMGTLYFDELDKTPHSETPALYSSMANHEFTVTKANLNASHIPSRQSGVFYCNPKGEHFMSNHPEIIKQQIPFESTAFLTRFHIVLCLFSYTVEEFVEVTRHQIKSELGKVKQSIIDDNLKIWNDYIEYARKYNIVWRHSKRAEELISIFAMEIYKQQKNLALPISARINEGIMALSEAYARSELSEKISLKHILKSIRLMLKCLSNIGLDERIVVIEINKYLHDALNEEVK